MEGDAIRAGSRRVTRRRIYRVLLDGTGAAHKTHHNGSTHTVTRLAHRHHASTLLSVTHGLATDRGYASSRLGYFDRYHTHA